MKKILLLYSLFIGLFFTSLAQESKKEAKIHKKETQYQELLEVLKTKKYEFIGRRATAQRGTPIDLTTRTNYVRIHDDNANAEMPYFGRAYSGGYSNSDGGIKFNATMENYQFTQDDKKMKAMIKFKVKGEGDTYNCTFSMSSLDNVSLSILSNNKQGISYTGFLNPLKEEK